MHFWTIWGSWGPGYKPLMLGKDLQTPLGNELRTFLLYANCSNHLYTVADPNSLLFELEKLEIWARQNGTIYFSMFCFEVCACVLYICGCSSKQCWYSKGKQRKYGCLIISFLVSHMAFVWTPIKHVHLCFNSHGFIDVHKFVWVNQYTLSQFCSTTLIPRFLGTCSYFCFFSLPPQNWWKKLCIYFCLDGVFLSVKITFVDKKIYNQKTSRFMSSSFHVFTRDWQ